MIDITIVGMGYLGRNSEDIDDTIRFEFEPTNEFDSKAICVYKGSEKVGYISKK